MKRSAILFASLAICMPVLSLAATEENPKPVIVENEPTVHVGNTVGVNVANVPTVEVGNTVSVDVLTTPDYPDAGIDGSDSPRLTEVQSTCTSPEGLFCVSDANAAESGKIVSMVLSVRKLSGDGTCVAAAYVGEPSFPLPEANSLKLAEISSFTSDSITLPMAVPISLEPDDILEVVGLAELDGRCQADFRAHLVVD